jgi:hypothetical protein
MVAVEPRGLEHVLWAYPDASPTWIPPSCRVLVSESLYGSLSFPIQWVLYYFLCWVDVRNRSHDEQRFLAQ